MDPRRALPSVEQVAQAVETAGLPHPLVVDAARDALDAARAAIAQGDLGHPAERVVADTQRRIDAIASRLLRPVINATGVLLHTNLGRAPLGREALDAVEAAAGATNLEYRLDEGRRGSRHEHAGGLLARACGAEAGIVVNNNAAALLLSLTALARGRSVVVSRGELVEIGGGFRVPDVMAESGARLVEVGTTNRTRRTDYAGACGPDTALLLKVHASNYRMVGFTEATGIGELAALGVPVMADLGSGLLDERTPWLGGRPPWLGDEPGVRQAVAAGASVVTFSGDKLLGGPQAGVIVGRADLIARIAAQPLARAVRADKMTLAAMQAVALAYLDGRAAEAIPLWRMAATPLAHLRARAEALAAGLDGAKVVDTAAAAGGGSLPGLTIPSVGVAVAVDDPDRALARLRELAVVALTRDDAVVADLRALEPAQDAALGAALRHIAGR